MPTLFFIFGITGDLARTKLLPALAHLYEEGLLPDTFSIVGFGRREWDDTRLREYVKEVLKDNASFKNHQDFIEHFTYQEGQFDLLASYERLALKIAPQANKLFYLAVPPSNYADIFKNLSVSKLSVPNENGWARILVEKPFGNNLKEAQSLNTLAKELFRKGQLFRIDHYLAKQTVQNIIAFRRNNSAYEKKWNNEYITEIVASLFEERSVGTRGAFYDVVGALKDVGQNHVLEMLALTLMNLPESVEADIQHLRTDVLHKLEVDSEFKAQYEGYTNEPGVQKDSKTETFFKVSARLENERWKGVKLIMQSGKNISPSEVRVDVAFKDGEVVTFFIQPKTSIVSNLDQKILDVNEKIGRDAYEKLFLDALQGEKSSFASGEEVEAAWKFTEGVIEKWKDMPLHTYAQKSKHGILES